MRGLECAAWGTLADAPQLKISKGGKSYAVANVAVNTGADDNGKPVSQWVRLCCFGEVAEDFAQAEKSSRVYFEGQLTASIWQPENGAARVNLNVAAWRVDRLGLIGKRRLFKERGHAVAAENFRQPDQSQAERQLRATDFTLNDPLPF